MSKSHVPSSRGCTTSIQTQVDGLKALTPGWYDGTGSGYDPAELDRVARMMRQRVEALGLPTPYLYPTPEGLVRAEWSTPEWEVVAKIDPARASVRVIMAHVGSEEQHEFELGPVWGPCAD